jgi:hypothetical protein
MRGRGTLGTAHWIHENARPGTWHNDPTVMGAAVSRRLVGRRAAPESPLQRAIAPGGTVVREEIDPTNVRRGHAWPPGPTQGSRAGRGCGGRGRIGGTMQYAQEARPSRLVTSGHPTGRSPPRRCRSRPHSAAGAGAGAGAGTGAAAAAAVTAATPWAAAGAAVRASSRIGSTARAAAGSHRMMLANQLLVFGTSACAMRLGYGVRGGARGGTGWA